MTSTGQIENHRCPFLRSQQTSVNNAQSKDVGKLRGRGVGCSIKSKFYAVWRAVKNVFIAFARKVKHCIKTLFGRVKKSEPSAPEHVTGPAEAKISRILSNAELHAQFQNDNRYDVDTDSDDERCSIGDLSDDEEVASEALGELNQQTSCDHTSDSSESVADVEQTVEVKECSLNKITKNNPHSSIDSKEKFLEVFEGNSETKRSIGSIDSEQIPLMTQFFEEKHWRALDSFQVLNNLESIDTRDKFQWAFGTEESLSWIQCIPPHELPRLMKFMDPHHLAAISEPQRIALPDQEEQPKVRVAGILKKPKESARANQANRRKFATAPDSSLTKQYWQKLSHDEVLEKFHLLDKMSFSWVYNKDDDERLKVCEIPPNLMPRVADFFTDDHWVGLTDVQLRENISLISSQERYNKSFLSKPDSWSENFLSKELPVDKIPLIAPFFEGKEWYSLPQKLFLDNFEAAVNTKAKFDKLVKYEHPENHWCYIHEIPSDKVPHASQFFDSGDWAKLTRTQVFDNLHLLDTQKKFDAALLSVENRFKLLCESEHRMTALVRFFRQPQWDILKQVRPESFIP